MLLIEGLLPENDCELGTQWKGMAKVCSTSFNLARSSCAHLKRFEASTSLGFLLDQTLVLDEKQLSDDEFIEMQIRVNLVVAIHQGCQSHCVRRQFTHLLAKLTRRHFP